MTGRPFDWGEVGESKRRYREDAAGLSMVEKLRKLDSLRERRHQLRAAVRPWSEEEVVRWIGVRLCEARRGDDPWARAQARALELLERGVEDWASALEGLHGLSSRTRSLTLLVWLWFRHHRQLLRDPRGKDPIQPHEPFSIQVGRLASRLNCDREFWILARFLAWPPERFIPREYLGDRNGWDFELEEEATGTLWSVEVTEGTTTERVDARREREQRRGSGLLGPWAGTEPEEAVAEVCVRTIEHKAQKATRRQRGSESRPTMLLVYPNIDELAVLEEADWQHVVEVARAGLDPAVLRDAFAEVWLVRNSHAPVAIIGPSLPAGEGRPRV